MRPFSKLAIIGVAASIAVPSSAEVRFVPLPPGLPFTALIGSGGTKATTEGVDFWTAGKPPRRYQMIGTITDSSEGKLLSAIPTSELAKKVREFGGDALLVLPMDDLPLEAKISLKNVPGLPKHQFWIIRYMPDDAYAIAEDDHAGQVRELKEWTDRQCSDPSSITRRSANDPAFSRAARDAIRSEVRRTLAEIAEATKDAPEQERARRAEMQRLVMQMLDCQEQQLAAEATNEALRGGIGAAASWRSTTRPGVTGSSTVTGEEKLADGGQCLTVDDVVIIDGEETVIQKRMCRRAGGGWMNA